MSCVIRLSAKSESTMSGNSLCFLGWSAHSRLANSRRRLKLVQKTFASPEDASTAFYQAAKAGDQAKLLAIFGENSQDTFCLR